MSTPTNIPETPMGETEQDSFFGSKEKFQEQLQDIFQTILRLTGPDHFDQLCQWMEYKQYTANEIHPKYALKKYRVQIACTLNKIYSLYRGHI